MKPFINHVSTDQPNDVRRIPPHPDPHRLEEDLRILRTDALNAGADNCAIIASSDVVFSPEMQSRVAADQSFPSVHWPLDCSRDDLESAIHAFCRGVFFRLDRIPGMPCYGGGPIPDIGHRALYCKIYEIVTMMESAAFYMGYHLALGLAAGNCRSVFCADEKRCRATHKGRACIRPNIGRPGMEAAGIDARAMATELNWNIESDGDRFELAGLVMIA